MAVIKKYEVFLIALVFIAINLHRLFDATGMRADIFVFYEHDRLLSNILYELGKHFTVLILSFILWMRVNKQIFLLCFIYLLLDFIGYILFFGQGVNLYIIIIVSLIAFYMLWRKK